MKNAFLLGILLLTVSCGSEKKHAVVGGQEEAYSENSEDKYDLPEIGFHREVTLNHRFESVYEDMTIKPYSKKAVPGIKPFVLYLNDSAAFKMDFYPNQDILKVSYVNYGTAIGVIKPNDVTLALVNDPRFKTVKSFVDEFTFGMSGSQYPEQDILGKVFI